jgi:hypothetical protein
VTPLSNATVFGEFTFLVHYHIHNTDGQSCFLVLSFFFIQLAHPKCSVL